MKKQFLMALAALSLLGGRTTAQEPACKPPLMGWSSWNAYRVNISEDIIKHQADLMVEKGLKDAGYRFINIDDGFFGYRDETGKMHEHAQRFPNGMKVVVDHIHNLGLKAGIYTDAGNNTCRIRIKRGSGPEFTGTKHRMPSCISGTGVLILLKSIIAGAVIWG